MAVRIKDIDLGFKDLVKAAARSGGLLAVAGIQGSESSASHGDVRNIDVAVFAEFGTSTAPERSFIRATVDREFGKYGRFMEAEIRNNIDSAPRMRRSFGRLAELMASDMRNTIARSIDLAPLAESTISRKGSSKPLLDTGQLRASITGVVLT